MAKKPSYKDLEDRIRALEQHNHQYRVMIDNTVDMISRHDPAGTYLYVSACCRDLTGYTAEELSGLRPAIIP